MKSKRRQSSFNRMLKNSFTPRLLKKVQMQGGARCEARGVLTRTSQRRASAPTRQMGLFQQPAKERQGVGLGLSLPVFQTPVAAVA
jgi:hypothetical protein